MNNLELERILNHELSSRSFADYAPNGLQVEGRSHVQKVVTGVTACQALLDAAVELDADAILVHHGYFWKGEPAEIKGIKRQRLKTLLANDINLYGYHLPLDAHHQLGNNAQLAMVLGLHDLGPLDADNPQALVWHGEFDVPQTLPDMLSRLTERLGRTPVHFAGKEASEHIRSVVWCSGGAQDYIDRAIEYGADAFITGEVSERTFHIAQECNIHFFAAGHHATERYGIKALGEWLEEHHDLDVTFVDINNPV